MASNISPKIPLQDCRNFLDDANNLLRGLGMIIGDLNSRPTDWATCNYSRGPTLGRWAKAHNFKVQQPPTPPHRQTGAASAEYTYASCMEPFPPVIEKYNFNEHWGHASAKTDIVDRSIDEFARISSSIFRITKLKSRINNMYKASLPFSITAFNHCISIEQMKEERKALIQAIVSPWFPLFP